VSQRKTTLKPEIEKKLKMAVTHYSDNAFSKNKYRGLKAAYESTSQLITSQLGSDKSRGEFEESFHKNRSTVLNEVSESFNE